jgi:sulfite reductase beta subunit-like hemoprotein
VTNPASPRHDRCVAINFCGGCNPAIDRKNLARAIARELVARGFTLNYNRWDVPFVVRLSGCTADCLTRYRPSAPADVVIAGKTFGAVSVNESELAHLAIDAAGERFGAGFDGAAKQVAEGLDDRRSGGSADGFGYSGR